MWLVATILDNDAQSQFCLKKKYIYDIHHWLSLRKGHHSCFSSICSSFGLLYLPDMCIYVGVYVCVYIYIYTHTDLISDSVSPPIPVQTGCSIHGQSVGTHT